MSVSDAGCSGWQWAMSVSSVCAADIITLLIDTLDAVPLRIIKNETAVSHAINFGNTFYNSISWGLVSNRSVFCCKA